MLRFLILCLLVFNANCYGNICDELNQTTQLFTNGEAQLQKHHYLMAIKLFDRGIEQIGDRYLSPNLSDDTGLKLMLSESVQQEGHLSQAAHLRRGVLSSRLSVLKEDNKQCHQ